MERIRNHLTYANVVASLGLFIALGGSAYAISLPKNSIGSKQIDQNAVGLSEMKSDAVASETIIQNKPGGTQALPQVCPVNKVLSLGQASSGRRQTAPGSAIYKCLGQSTPSLNGGVPPCPSPDTAAGAMCLSVPGVYTAQDVNTKPAGLPSCLPGAKAAELCVNSVVNPIQTLAQGQTVRGVIGMIGPLEPSASYHAYASLPVPAPELITDGDVLIDGVYDPNNNCTGSFIAPTAPEGTVCIYLTFNAGTASVEGHNLHDNQGSQFGFAMRIDTAATPPAQAGANGSWAYTAGDGGGGGGD